VLTPYFDKPEIEFMGPGVRPSKAGSGSANARKEPTKGNHTWQLDSY
jgi:hypothetical protein